MVDQRIEKLANLLVRYSIDAKKGQEIVINTSSHGTPLAQEVLREVLQVGAYPIMMGGVDGTDEIFYKYASDDQLKFISPIRKYIAKKAHASIGIRAPTNTRSLSAISSKKMAISSKASKEIGDSVSRRTWEGKFKWVGLVFPSNAMAQEAGMSLRDYEDFVYSACLVDKKDPISEWKMVEKNQSKMIKRLSKVEKIRFIGEGTDISMSVKGRKWVNCCGKRNMPDGEVFTSPVESSVNGAIKFTYPGLYMGKEIKDICLEFKKGKIVKSKAEMGEEHLKELLKIDPGAQRLGEVSIGTNTGIKRFSKSILFDEKIGGTIHMAVGRGYPETGSKNTSSIHWDMIKDMKKDGEIFADGELIYKNGKFLG